VKIEIDQIKDVLEKEVLKREVIDGDKADAARKKMVKAMHRALRKVSRDEQTDTALKTGSEALPVSEESASTPA
jgi:hypothetical protein